MTTLKQFIEKTTGCKIKSLSPKLINGIKLWLSQEQETYEYEGLEPYEIFDKIKEKIENE